MAIADAIVLEAELPVKYLSWPFHERVCLISGYTVDDTHHITGFHPVPNRANDTRRLFAISKLDYHKVNRKCRRKGTRVLGVIHTHRPSAPQTPSGADLSGIPTNWIGGLYLTATGEVIWY